MAVSRADFARVPHIPRRWQRMPPAGLLAAATLVAIAAVLPVFYLLVKTLDGGTDAWSIIARVRTAEILGRTGLLVATVTGFSVVLAVPMAWLTTRTTMPFRRATDCRRRTAVGRPKLRDGDDRHRHVRTKGRTPTGARRTVRPRYRTAHLRTPRRNDCAGAHQLSVRIPHGAWEPSFDSIPQWKKRRAAWVTVRSRPCGG